ncbi:armadillo-type protein [Phakopsora pachyrhizi]|uniref:V-type proton ATPase subunit H n=1 Tax=Phakopsora pachyrhizi TaxID=170000 RepID=A0AAV0AHN8_PHAPC|nr:armadillo-type protein [Phakopsora pachyrhizi]KAI8451442.1 armadillo-type protein [Phakopsora pachyrhizi]CAH7666830.1 armadillo-type protein [Phakopsora pachyrhizi]
MTTIFYNTWLEELDYRTRIKEIPWEGYHRASLISETDLSLLQAVSGVPKSKKEQVWNEKTEAYVTLYLRLLSELNRTDCLQAIMVEISDLLNDHDDRVRLLLDLPEPKQSSAPYSSFTRHLDSSDLYSRSKALSLLSFLLGFSSEPESSVLAASITGIGKLLASSDSNQQELGIECLQHILRQPIARSAVWAQSADSSSSDSETSSNAIISRLVDQIRVGNRLSAEVQYRVSFCFWLLTFDKEVASQLNKRHAAVPILIELARQAVKEKVIRVLVATLRNLAEKSPEVNLSVLLVAGNLLPLIQSFSTRKWSDDELKEDISWLKDQLEEAKRKMTTYDEYSAELESGLLRWSPTHTSEDFWSQNAEKLNNKDYQQLKVLIRILSEATDPIVLAVAANDLSKYVKHCEIGKRSAEKLGAKARVMDLMSHKDPEVKYWALVSVQQLISQPWAH